MPFKRPCLPSHEGHQLWYVLSLSNSFNGACSSCWDAGAARATLWWACPPWAGLQLSWRTWWAHSSTCCLCAPAYLRKAALQSCWEGSAPPCCRHSSTLSCPSTNWWRLWEPPVPCPTHPSSRPLLPSMTSAASCKTAACAPARSSLRYKPLLPLACCSYGLLCHRGRALSASPALYGSLQV